MSRRLSLNFDSIKPDHEEQYVSRRLQLAAPLLTARNPVSLARYPSLNLNLAKALLRVFGCNQAASGFQPLPFGSLFVSV